MDFTVDELLAYARQHQGDRWTTLVRGSPFRFRVTNDGIEFIPSSGKRRIVARRFLESFCDEFRERSGSFSPRDYPDRWNKSYTLPIIRRYLDSRTQAA
jgi:hypothetical protein